MMNKNISELEKIIDVKFNDSNLLKKSLIHKSFDNNENNEKLEFLGDRVLGLVLSKTLISIYINEKEGINEKIISDGLEALIGAIFLDKGLFVVEKFILKFWKNYIDKSDFTLIDSKTKLQEYSLKKFKKLPIYKGFKRTGPVHKPLFKVEVQIIGSKTFFGTGGSKKIAQQNAAEKLLKDMKIK